MCKNCIDHINGDCVDCWDCNDCLDWSICELCKNCINCEAYKHLPNFISFDKIRELFSNNKLNKNECILRFLYMREVLAEFNCGFHNWEDYPNFMRIISHNNYTFKWEDHYNLSLKMKNTLYQKNMVDRTKFESDFDVINALLPFYSFEKNDHTLEDIYWDPESENLIEKKDEINHLIEMIGCEIITWNPSTQEHFWSDLSDCLHDKSLYDHIEFECLNVLNYGEKELKYFDSINSSSIENLYKLNLSYENKNVIITINSNSINKYLILDILSSFTQQGKLNIYDLQISKNGKNRIQFNVK